MDASFASRRVLRRSFPNWECDVTVFPLIPPQNIVLVSNSEIIDDLQHPEPQEDDRS